MGEKNMYKKSKLFDKEGFYIILFVCLCVVAVTAVLVSRNNAAKNTKLTAETKKTNTMSRSTDPLLTLTEDARKSIETSRQPVKSIEDVKKGNGTGVSASTKKNPTTAESSSKDMGKKLASAKTSNHSAANGSKRVLEAFKIDPPLPGQLAKHFDDKELQYAKAINQWETHEGIDITADLGSEVKAVAEGKVLEIKTADEKLLPNEKNGFGASVIIDHGNGYRTVYANLALQGIRVKVGEQVKSGSVIGVVGDTSQREAISLEGSHLHFEVLKAEGNQYLAVNPEKFFKSASR